MQIDSDLVIYRTTLLRTFQVKPPPHSSLKPPPPRAVAAAARLRRKIVSGQFDEENPFVLISSVLLVQADEGVSFLVVDRIGDIYRNLPRRADVIVTTVGARHKCQQGQPKYRRLLTLLYMGGQLIAAPLTHYDRLLSLP
ncbi:hypothetical protein F511_43825 [Dorcoceras hygrometricum]|uniref:Uncharacterized protein n=1 Tax=Dorcoceras hygrometricum TaxID=472368 RepID=A0A2Z7B3H8_9LAMI|nr:hypothetical protein F511_43825 [Dorcoceras hygrometricum]